jgi:hypothetical protein
LDCNPPAAGQSLTDIVSERYDAGVRAGGQVAKDMIAVRIGPDLRGGGAGLFQKAAGAEKTARPHWA